MANSFLLYLILTCFLVLNTIKAVPVPSVDLVTTSSIQIGGIVREGRDPIKWDDQLLDKNSQRYSQLQTTLCTTFREALKVIKTTWAGCEIVNFHHDTENSTLVYATAKVTLTGEEKVDLDRVRLELLTVFSPSSYENVLGGNISVSVKCIEIGGIVQQGPYPIIWNDDYANNTSELFKDLEQALCKSITEAETILSTLWQKCNIISLQRDKTDASQVYALVNIELPDGTTIDLEKVKQELETAFSNSTNAVNLGAVSVQVPKYITTLTSKISGTVLSGQTPLKWDPLYADDTSDLFKATQQALCSNLKKSFTSLNIKPTDCYVINMVPKPGNKNEVYANLIVTFDQEATINVEQLKQAMQQLIVSNKNAIIIGDDIVVTAETITTTATTPTSVEEVTTSSLIISGTVLQGKTPLPWDPDLSSSTSDLFNITQQALCTSIYQVLKYQNIVPKKCQIIKMQPSLSEPNHVYAHVNLAFDPEATIDIAELKRGMQQLITSSPNAVILGSDMVITPETTTTTTETVESTSTTTTTAEITTSSLQISGTVFVGPDPLDWSPKYTDNSSPEFKQNEHELCRSLEDIFKSMNIIMKTCRIPEMMQISGNKVYANVDVTFEPEATVNVDELIKAMREYPNTNPRATIIGGDIQVTTGEPTTTATMTTTETATATTPATTTTTLVDKITTSSLQISGTVFVGPKPLEWTPIYSNTSSSQFKQNEYALCRSLEDIFKSMNIMMKTCRIPEMMEILGNKVYANVDVTFEPEATVNVDELIKAMKEYPNSNPSATIIGGEIQVTTSETTTPTHTENTTPTTAVIITTTTPSETTTTTSTEITTPTTTVIITTTTPLQEITTSSLQISGTVFVGTTALEWIPEYNNTSSSQFVQNEYLLCSSLKDVFESMNITMTSCQVPQLTPASGNNVHAIVEVTFEPEATVNVKQLIEAMQELVNNNRGATVLGGEIQIAVGATTIGSTTTVSLGITDVTNIQIGGIIVRDGIPLPWKEAYKDLNSPEVKELQEMGCNSIRAALHELQNNWNTCQIIETADRDSKTYARFDITLNVLQTMNLDDVKYKVETSSHSSHSSKWLVDHVDLKVIK